MAKEAATTEQIQGLIESIFISAWEALGISVLASVFSVILVGLATFIYRKGLYEHIQNAIKRTQLNIQGEWLAEGEITPEGGGEKYSYRD